MKKIIYIGLLAISLLCLPSCAEEPADEATDSPVREEVNLSKDAEEGAKEPTDSAKKAFAGATATPIFVSLLVNGNPALETTVDMPLIVTCTVHNALTESLALNGAAVPAPVLETYGETVTPVAADPTGPEEIPFTVPPGGGLQVRWIVQPQQPLEPGMYRVRIAEGTELIAETRDKAAPVAVLVEPAYITIVQGTASAEEKARMERRVLSVQGDVEGMLAALDTALAASPQDHALRYERVQALKAAGRREEAHAALAQLIRDTEQALRTHASQAEAHLPSWYYAELRSLRSPGGGVRKKIPGHK